MNLIALFVFLKILFFGFFMQPCLLQVLLGLIVTVLLVCVCVCVAFLNPLSL